jgi:chemotaxis protein MotB
MANLEPTIVIRKKINKTAHGGHGGAWKVAYADFVTAMMAFFLVMWLMGTDEETRTAIAAYFSSNGAANGATEVRSPRDSGDSILQGQNGDVPEELVRTNIPPVSKQPKEFLELRELLMEMLDGQIISVDVTIDLMKFSVYEDLFFAPHSTHLKADASKYLDRLGQIFRGFKGRIKITSHSNEAPPAGKTFNSQYEFAMARAVAIMDYFVENRWAAEDMITPEGSGPVRMIASNDTPEGRRKNHRIEFTLSRLNPK